jgi:NAD(P)-dependent dehydrogenase (short-subunit alcohol dehydrogenase family)
MPTPHAGEFSGLAALITGGASGIGLATARLMASRGARVAILDREVPEVVSGSARPAAAAGVARPRGGSGGDGDGETAWATA